MGNLNEEMQKQLFMETDKDSGGDLDFTEFLDLIVKYAMRQSKIDKKKIGTASKKPKTARHPTTLLPPANTEPKFDDAQEEADTEEMPEDLADLSPDEQHRLTKRAFVKLFVGTVLVLIFTDPICQLLTITADKMKISSFYVSFVLAPLAANASELVAAL